MEKFLGKFQQMTSKHKKNKKKKKNERSSQDGGVEGSET